MVNNYETREAIFSKPTAVTTLGGYYTNTGAYSGKTGPVVVPTGIATVQGKTQQYVTVQPYTSVSPGFAAKASAAGVNLGTDANGNPIITPTTTHIDTQQSQGGFALSPALILAGLAAFAVVR